MIGDGVHTPSIPNVNRHSDHSHIPPERNGTDRVTAAERPEIRTNPFAYAIAGQQSDPEVPRSTESRFQRPQL